LSAIPSVSNFTQIVKSSEGSATPPGDQSQSGTSSPGPADLAGRLSPKSDVVAVDSPEQADPQDTVEAPSKPDQPVYDVPRKLSGNTGVDRVVVS
jgi:hypothetical protein